MWDSNTIHPLPAKHILEPKHRKTNPHATPLTHPLFEEKELVDLGCNNVLEIALVLYNSSASTSRAMLHWTTRT